MNYHVFNSCFPTIANGTQVLAGDVTRYRPRIASLRFPRLTVIIIAILLISCHLYLVKSKRHCQHSLSISVWCSCSLSGSASLFAFTSHNYWTDILIPCVIFFHLQFCVWRDLSKHDIYSYRFIFPGNFVYLYSSWLFECHCYLMSCVLIKHIT